MYPAEICSTCVLQQRIRLKQRVRFPLKLYVGYFGQRVARGEGVKFCVTVTVHLGG